MKKFYHQLITLFILTQFLFTGNAGAQTSFLKTDAAIQAVVNEINQDSIRNIILTLQNYGTRFMNNANRKQIYKWIKSKFISYGYTDVVIDSFYCNTTFHSLGISMQYNVIAKLPGLATPSSYFITAGHYDSFCTQDLYNAPGADDDASGTAAVLEAARAVKKLNYQPASTLLFIAFASEEVMNYGDSGSKHYSSAAKNNGMDIKLMINNDMIAYSPYNPEYSIVDINYYEGYEYLRDFAKSAASAYSKVPPINGAYNQMADGYPFYANGFPVVYFEEHIFSPFYHSTSDRVDNYNMPYCTEIAKASCATLLAYQQSLTPVERNLELPVGFVLCQNYPNPFNPSTIIEYSLPPHAGMNTHVSLKVFDILGREVALLVNEVQSPGKYRVNFNGNNLAGGNYFYALNAGMTTITKKLTLLK